MLMVDLSRQRMTLETLNHLLRLGTARDLPKFIRQLSWGPNDPDNPLLPTELKQKDYPDPNKKMIRSQVSSRGDEENYRDEEMRSSRKDSKNQKETRKQRPFCSIPSYHMSLRVPSDRKFEMLGPNGANVLTEIHNSWDRIRRISESLRRGKLPGVTGGMIKDVVVVGRGLSIMALRFVYLALCKDEAATIGRRVGIAGGSGQRRIKFLTTVDPVRAAAVVADSDPSSTIVVTIAMIGEEETQMAMIATRTLQTWLLTNLGGHGRRPEVILGKHCMLITSNDELAAEHKAESVFLIPDHSRCEPFTTFTAASLLPLSIVFGWSTVEAFLAGAHDVDLHFVETNPRHNLPVLLALTDIWNDCLLSPLYKNNPDSNNAGRIVTPYTEAFAAYPAFVAALEAQICGRKRFDASSTTTSSPSARYLQTNLMASSTSTTQSSTCFTVIDGGLHGIYDRSLHQSSKIIPCELVMTLDSQLHTNGSLKGGGGTQEIYQAQDALMCSLFAHADGLAFGSDMHKSNSSNSPDDESMVGAGDEQQNSVLDGEQLIETHSSNGNRPSTLLLCGRLDAFTCGQLAVMAEHRAAVKAWICEIDPFPKKVSSRSRRSKMLKESLERMMSDKYSEEDDDGDETENAIGLNLSTKTILQHYANMVKSQRKKI
jgi:glucose-6-phosphate isomerase